MAGKARVHELAKELGVTSKQVLERLKEQGEFVKSASSTVEAPVARRLREALGAKTGAATPSAPPAAAARVADTKPSHSVRPGSFTCTRLSQQEMTIARGRCPSVASRRNQAAFSA